MRRDSKASTTAHFARNIRLSCKYLGIACLPFMSACAPFGDDIHDLKDRCHAEARIVIHNSKLWKEYVAGANQNYLERKSVHLDTGRAVPEYAPGFEKRYGRDLREQRSEAERAKGKVARDDIYILKEGKIIGQFVDFGLHSDDFVAPIFFDCTGVFPDVYADVL